MAPALKDELLGPCTDTESLPESVDWVSLDPLGAAAVGMIALEGLAEGVAPAAVNSDAVTLKQATFSENVEASTNVYSHVSSHYQ